MAEISDLDRHYDASELWSAGQAKMSPAICRDCHNDNAVCVLRVGDTPGSTEHRTAYEVTYTDRSGYHETFPLNHANQTGQAGAACQTGAKSADTTTSEVK
jgi:hypothetical protein